MQKPAWNGSLWDPARVNSRRSASQKFYFNPLLRLPTHSRASSRGSNASSVVGTPRNHSRRREGDGYSAQSCMKCDRCGWRMQVPEPPQPSDHTGPEWNAIRNEYSKIISTLETGLTSAASMRFLRRELDALRSRVQQLDVGDASDKEQELLVTPSAKDREELDDSPSEKTVAGKGKGKGKVPAPPPLPRCLSKPKSAKQPKTRRLQWQSISKDSIAGTVFEDMPWDSVMSCSTERVQDLFAVRSSARPVRKKRHKIELLTQRRAQSMLIVLRACPLTSKLLSTLEALDFNAGIDPDVCEMLYTAVPTSEESKLLLSYTGDMSDLRDAERRVLPLARICNPTVDKRLQFLLFNHALPDLVSDINGGFSLLQMALRNVKESNAIRAVLRHTRHLGNLLNHGLTQFSDEAVAGFSIDILDRLVLLKASSDTRISLLHVLVSQLLVEDESLLTALLDLAADIGKALERPAYIMAESIAAVHQEVEQCSKCAEEVKAAAVADADSGLTLTKGERIASNLATLAELAARQVSLFDEQLARTRSLATETLVFFGETVQNESSIDAKMEDFFKMLSHFLADVDRVYINEVKARPSVQVVCCGKDSESSPLVSI